MRPSFLLSTLRPGQTFIDVGAHVGYFSVLAAKRIGSTGSVVAVEPEARNLRLLRRNLQRNGCTNATVVPFAAHSVPGWMSLELDEENRGGHHLVPLGEAETRVRCVRLDDVLPARVDLVKIDAQGYDHEIIAGLERTLTTNPQATVIAELSLTELARRGVQPEVVLDRYTALGLTISTCDTYGRLRRASSASVIEAARAGRLTAEISLVLQRPPSFPAAERCPAKADGLEVSEAQDGLLVVDPTLGRTHARVSHS